ncbi:MAG: BamA/TamA family outer membrane protein [Flavobacteriales bacterium]|nr:BamA/TamA family outer membrane protein [Flavobacteriales bacterium]
MKRVLFYTVFIYSLSLINGCNPTKHLADNDYLLYKVIVEVNGEVDEEQIGSIVKQQSNRKILGFSRFHLGVYNMFDEIQLEEKIKKKEQKLLIKNEQRIKKNKEPKLYTPTFGERILDIVAEEPVIYDKILTQKSTKNINQFLINNGYFNGVARDSVSIKDKKVTVYYYVDEKTPYKIFKISYRCYDMDIKLHLDTISRERLIKPADIFNTDILEEERERISLEMKDRGYYYFNKEYVYMEVDSNLNKHKLNIKIISKNPTLENDSIITELKHYRYKLNNIYVHTNHNPRKPNQIHPTQDTLFYNGYYYIYNDILPFRPEILEKSIFIKKETTYNLGNVSDTHRRLSSMRTFKYIRIDFTDLKTNKHLLDGHIYLAPSAKMALTTEVEGTHQGGFFGVAGNVSYRNKNTFKGAEIFETKFSGGLEVQQVVLDDNSNSNQDNIQKYTPFNTIEIMPEMSLYKPSIWIPFVKHPFRKVMNPSTKVSLAYSHQRRPDYTRNIAKLSFGYTGSTSNKHSHLFYPVDLSYVNIDKQPYFAEQLLTSKNSYLINTYQNHLIVASKYSYIFNSQELDNPYKNYVYFLFDIEGSGNILRAISQQTSFETNSTGGYEILGVQYAQYVKPEIDVRKYLRMGKVFNKHDSWLIYRFYSGIGIPFKNLTVLPFEKSYYGGGANGIRAWEARTLGPGSLNDVLTGGIDQIADIHIEANIEYRFEIIDVLEGAFFIDAGNIWLRNLDTLRPGANFEFNRFHKEIAIGAGVGARVNLDILIIRLDLGFPLYNPALVESERWFFQSKTTTNNDRLNAFGLGFIPYRTKPVLNIGIGYPF